MINHDTEELIPLELAAQRVPGRPAISTLYRWSFKGVRGTVLETLVIGNRRWTSIEAISRFIAAMNAPKGKAPQMTENQRQKQNEAAKRRLEAAGV